VKDLRVGSLLIHTIVR